LNSRWHGGGLGYKGVNYNIGPSPEDIVLNLDSQQEYLTTPIWNVIGTINGEIEDEVIILGNHRDSWSSGAADPNSGSAALNEVIRSFGVALKHGWKPRRTVMFGSWDGQEYAFLGSTEWTEENFSWLSASTVAYLNVVVAASGKAFNAHASPLLQKVIHSATNKVLSPNQTSPGQTVLDVWGGKLSPAGGGDAIIFLDTLGISTVDIGFSAGPEDPIYPYHSSYDTLDWMDRFGDPTWEHHRAITQIWSLMAASLVEAPLLPLRVTDYAEHFQTYLQALKELAPPSFDFQTLEVAINQFHHASVHFDAYAASLEGSTCSSSKAETFRSRIAESNRKCKTSSRIRAVNKIYKRIERMFLYEPGLDHRSWVKHVVYAPSSYYSSSAAFPGLVESFAAGNVTNANVSRSQNSSAL
jgi:N-acetylated-alpha-linked acidic dipeptidase